MKKVIFIAFTSILAWIAFPSCNFQNNTFKESTSDTQSDQEVVVTHAIEEEPSFTSPDLQWAGVQGHVKSIIETHQNGSNSYKITYRFNEQGRLTYMHNGGSGNTCQIHRVQNDKIHEIQEGEYPDDESTTYTYNADGYVIKTKGSWFQGGNEVSYTLNANGCPSQETEESYGYFGNIEYQHSYQSFYRYTASDNEGNWTACTKSSTLINFKSNDASYTPDVKQYTETITRKIEYYE